MKRYDLHTHTNHSKCSNMEPSILLKQAKKLKLDGIAVTDHNTINGALKIRKLNKDKEFEVIVGNEIKTEYGDVILYYTNDEFGPANLLDVLDKAKEQDAIVAIPHPFRTPHHLSFKYDIEKIKNRIHAIECFNSRTLPGDNKKADKLAENLKLAKTGGSDSHFEFEIGKAQTIFDGDLRKAIKSKSTVVKGTILFGPVGGLVSFMRNRVL